MAAYPDYDVLHITEQSNGDLHLENDSFWYPSFALKLLSEFLETKLQIAETKSNFFALSGCMNAFMVPAQLKDEFYRKFENNISNGKISFKTDYNEKYGLMLKDI